MDHRGFQFSWETRYFCAQGNPTSTPTTTSRRGGGISLTQHQEPQPSHSAPQPHINPHPLAALASHSTSVLPSAGVGLSTYRGRVDHGLKHGYRLGHALRYCPPIGML